MCEDEKFCWAPDKKDIEYANNNLWKVLKHRNIYSWILKDKDKMKCGYRGYIDKGVKVIYGECFRYNEDEIRLLEGRSWKKIPFYRYTQSPYFLRIKFNPQNRKFEFSGFKKKS